MFNFHGWIAPHIFPFLKLTQCNKWVFHSFLGNRGSFHYIFLSTPWIRCALYSTVGIIWIDWMLTFRRCSLWCKCCGRDSKGHYSQSIHTCLPPCGGLQIGWRGLEPPRPPRECRRDDILSIFTCEYGWVQAAHRSLVLLCLHVLCFWSLSAFVSSHVCFPRRMREAHASLVGWYRIMRAGRVSGGMWWCFLQFKQFVE